MSEAASSRAASMPKFQIGQIVATPDALRMLQQAGVFPMTLLARHAFGDWGDLCDEDRMANERALVIGDRIFSCYQIGVGLSKTKVWVITDADRASTCLLLPEEY